MSSKYPVLSEALTKRYALPEADADKFVAQMFDVLLKAVEQEGVVKVKGLGTFKLTPVGARESVDVNTGERIVIDSRNKITFVPDVVLRDRVNSPFAQFETVVLNDGVEFSSLDENLRQKKRLRRTMKTKRLRRTRLLRRMRLLRRKKQPMRRMKPQLKIKLQPTVPLKKKPKPQYMSLPTSLPMLPTSCRRRRAS